MSFSLQALPDLASFIFLASLKATLLVALVLLLQRVAGKLLSAGARYLLWLSVVIGLVTPVGFHMELPAAVLPDVPVSGSAFLSAAENRTLIALEQRATSSASVAASAAFSLPAQGVQAEPPTMTDPPFPWFSLLSYLWLAGVLVVLAAIALSSYRFARIVRRAAIAPHNVQNFLQDCMRQTACKVAVTVLHSAEVQVPMIAGLFRPVLLLPTGLELQVTRAQLRHVFLHELMHLQRGDIISNWIVALVQALHWFNPVIWFAFFCMRQDRELACDAATLNHLAPADRAAYGHTLLQLNDTLPHSSLPALALGILDSPSDLQRRILMLVQSPRYKKLQSFVFVLLFLPLAAVAFSQPASRAAEPVATTLEPAAAIAETVIAAVEPATVIAESATGPVTMAGPAPVITGAVQPAISIPAETVMPAQTAPAELARQVRSLEPAVRNATLVAQLEAAPAAAPFEAATATTDLAAATTAQELSAEPDEDLSAAIQLLAEHISAARSASFRFIEDLDRAATECAAKGDGVLAALSMSCSKTRRALRKGGTIFQFGYQCYVLDHRQEALAAHQRAAATLQPDVDNLLRENERSLATFCNKEAYSNNYPAFAALVPNEEYTQDYVLRERQRVARALPARGGRTHDHGDFSPGIMASSTLYLELGNLYPNAVYPGDGTCCSGNTQPSYGTGFGPSDFGGGAAVPAGGGEVPSAPAP